MPDELVVSIAALAKLTPRQRELWFDHRIIGLTIARLADREGVSSAAVWQLIRKADRKLQRDGGVTRLRRAA